MAQTPLNPHDITWASYAKNPPPFAIDVRRRGVKGQGVKYEKAAKERLRDEHSGFLIQSPWIMYRASVHGEGIRWCQPDALVIRPDLGTITIVEIKLRHTPDAFYQLCGLYLPVLQHIFPSNLWGYRLMEMCCWYDHDRPFPGRYRLRRQIRDIMPNEVGVFIWNPKRRGRA